MKKIFLVAIAFIGFSTLSSAQEMADNAIGLRLSDSDGIGPGINYQRAIGDNNRLELDLGWRDGSDYNAFKLAVLYQWVWELDGNFNWYAGAGGGIGSVKIKDAPQGSNDSDTFFFAAGDVGIEYNFDIPLLLSLDFRPEIGFGSDDFDTNDVDFDIALGIRYQF